jgi:crotonobetainyl-CoA:carnitine CoA-transferase CaiB-like acyl-CoA transferase
LCGQLLADMGAEVINREPPGVGDPMRQQGETQPKGVSAWFAVAGRNSRCARFDLRTGEAPASSKRPPASAGIAIDNFRARVPKQSYWGLGYPVFRTLIHDPIRCGCPAMAGPDLMRKSLAAPLWEQASLGCRCLLWEQDRASSRAGFSIGDSVATSSTPRPPRAQASTPATPQDRTRSRTTPSITHPSL